MGVSLGEKLRYARCDRLINVRHLDGWAATHPRGEWAFYIGGESGLGSCTTWMVRPPHPNFSRVQGCHVNFSFELEDFHVKICCYIS